MRLKQLITAPEKLMIIIEEAEAGTTVQRIVAFGLYESGLKVVPLILSENGELVEIDYHDNVINMYYDNEK